MPNPTYNKYKKLRQSAMGTAIINLIAKGESTSDFNASYYEHDGGELTTDLSKHPGKKPPTAKSTAFGRYKFTKDTWDRAQRALGLKDMSPESQDIAAVWLADKQGAVKEFEKGNIDKGVYKLGTVWASLPKNEKGETISKSEDGSVVYANGNPADYQNEYLRKINKAKTQELANNPKKREEIADSYFKKLQKLRDLKLSPEKFNQEEAKIKNEAFIDGNGEIFNEQISKRNKENTETQNILSLLGQYKNGDLNEFEIKSLKDNLKKKGIKVFEDEPQKGQGKGVYINPGTGKSFNSYGEKGINVEKTISNLPSHWAVDYNIKPADYKKNGWGYPPVDQPAPETGPEDNNAIVDNSSSNGSGTGNSNNDATVNMPIEEPKKREWTAEDMAGNFMQDDMLGDPKFKYTPGKKAIPIDSMVSLAQGIMGMVQGDVDVKYRDEKISEGLLNYAAELEQIKNIGLPPEIEADLNMKLADAYQTGLSNLVRASNGNRNLVLGNQGQLDKARMSGVVQIAAMDTERRDKAMAAYGEVQKYISEFNANRSIANNERAYREDEKSQIAGATLAQLGMSSLVKNLQADRENGPGSANDMMKQFLMFHISGVNPNQPDDGTPGSPSYMAKAAEENQARLSESDKAAKYINSLPIEQRNAMAKRIATDPAMNFNSNKDLKFEDFKKVAETFTNFEAGKEAFNEAQGTSDALEKFGLTKKESTPNEAGTISIHNFDDNNSGADTPPPTFDPDKWKKKTENTNTSGFKSKYEGRAPFPPIATVETNFTDKSMEASLNHGLDENYLKEYKNKQNSLIDEGKKLIEASRVFQQQNN